MNAQGAQGARRWLPWLVAVAILAFLVREVRLDTLREALRHGPWLALAAYIVLEVVLALPADTFGTREALAAAGVRRPWREVLLARGASYLLGLLSYVAGQGGMGFHLARTGVPVGRSAGAVLLLMIANGIVLVLLGAAGLGIELARGGLEGAPTELLALTVAAAFSGTLAYLLVIAIRPRWLERYSLLAPLLEAGVAGHLRAIAARFPHMLLLVVLHWGAFRVWGIEVPFFLGLALNPIVLLIAALPVTPGGLGTTQALQVLFFGPYASAPIVLAFSLVHHVIGQMVQAAVGFVCLAILRREP
ncbi:MAG TPA: lysylphosphatidylglycerol synthase transmembrane domain-containing protein [Thermoanaerobaculia bacterium]|nr:lysylphosphatidylglycerol synthase transmembrane domain-containing protein [Thermoanaerobaculia bacterium]